MEGRAVGNEELTLIAADGTELTRTGGKGSARKKENSILWWAQVYWETNVAGSPDGTLRAKKSDLQLFLGYFSEVVGGDQVDYWTPSVSKSFRTWLQKSNPRKPKRKYQKAYAPTSVNRTLATLRHFAKEIITQRPFEAGNPMKGVDDLTIQAPEWDGLTSIELARLRAALDQVTQLSKRANQMPLRNRAVFTVALDTGLRAFELTSLNIEQYQGKYLKQVQGKGRSYSDVYLSTDARHELDAYIEGERGDSKAEALFITNRQGRLTRQQADRFFKKIAAHANSKLPPEEHIKLHAHMLRHTGTKRVYTEHGAVEAKSFGRHQSFKQLERYAAQTKEEREKMVDELWG